MKIFHLTRFASIEIFGKETFVIALDPTFSYFASEEEGKLLSLQLQLNHKMH